MNPGASTAQSLSHYDSLALASFNAARVSHGLPPVESIPKPRLSLIQGGAE